MAFICNDCGNKSTKKFPQGKCPACDSFNIKTTHKTTQQAIKEKEPKTLIELVILALLWGLLAYGVWDKYLKPEPTPTGITSKAFRSSPLPTSPAKNKHKVIMPMPF